MTAPDRLAKIHGLLDALVAELRAMHEEQSLVEWIDTRGEAMFCEYEFDKLCDRVEGMLKKAGRVRAADLFEPSSGDLFEREVG